MNKNILTLSKCAYIWHWSNSTFFYGSKEEREAKQAQHRALRKLYDMSDDARTFQYRLTDFGAPAIMVDGINIVCNEMMLKCVLGDYALCDIVNGRVFPYIELKNLPSERWKKMSDTWYQSKTFKTLGFDIASDGLQYIELRWNGDRLRFIISCGALYECCSDNHYRQITISEITNRLGIKSARAKRHINELFNIIL